MKDLTIGLNSGRHIFRSDNFEDLQKIAELLADPQSEVVMTLDSEEEGFTLCNSTTKEKFIKASPDDLLDWIFGFREL